MAKAAKTIRAVGYVRRSTDRQEQSIDDQKKALKQYAIEHNFRFMKYYVDDAISGTSTLKRRSFLQMIEDAQKKTRAFDIIIVYDIKRFGRVDNDEAGYYRHILRRHGVEILYVTENFNGDTTDDLLRPVKQWQARQESRDLSKVTIRGLLSKVEGGCWMGGTPPYGYDLQYETTEGIFLYILQFMPDGSKRLLDNKGTLIRALSKGEILQTAKSDKAKLIPGSSERVRTIKHIFKMYTEQGKGYKAIAHTLNGQNIPTARNRKWAAIYSGLWTASTIRSLIDNPIYAGDMVWNRRTDARFHRISNKRAVDRENVHGARLVPNNKKDWIIVRDAHESLISRRVFEQAKNLRQNKLSSIEQRGLDPRLRTSGRTWQGQRSRFILSGLMRCSLCNNRYQGVTRTKGGRLRLDGTRTTTYYYGCGGYITKGVKICQKHFISKELLENRVINSVLHFYKHYLSKEGKYNLAKKVKELSGCEGRDLTDARERIKTEHIRINRIIDNLLDNLTASNRDDVDKRLGQLKEQKAQLETRLEELDRLSLSQDQIKIIVADAMTFIASLEYTLKEGLPQEKLVALRQCIERIWVNKSTDKLKINIKYET